MRRFTSFGILTLFFSLCLFVGPAVATVDDDIPGTPLSIGSALSGTTSAGDANDVYAVTLTAGEEVHIQCDPGLTADTGGTFHLLTPGVIALSDPDGYDELVYTLSGGSPIRYWADYDYIPAKSGTYYLWVEWSEGSLNYQLSITRTARTALIMAPDSDDIPGTSVGSGTVTGVASSKADPDDLYAVGLTAGQPVTIRLIPLTPYNNNGSSLAYLSLLDPSTPSISNYYGHQLGERVMATNNKDAASRVTAEIQYTPTQTGTHFIWVEPNPYGYNFAYQLSVTVGTTAPVLTFNTPSGLGTYTSAQTIPVGWSSNLDLDTGQFGVWARSAAGTWYVGQLVATGAADDVLTYSANLALTGVPAGWYQVIVGYRPTLGSGTWVSWATSYSFVFSVDAAVTPAVTITAPTGQGSYTSSESFTATWTASPSLTTGQFAVWVRSADGLTWYWKAPVVPATGAGSYSAPVSLAGITPGLGYQVIVAYEPIANTGFWMSWATSPGVFSVDAVAPTINISAPAGTTSYSTSQSVTASWATNQNLTGGQFGVWVRTGAGGYFVTTLVSATGTTGTVYSTALPLAGVPTGSGNQVIISYRPATGTGAFMSWATSPGSFTVTP